MFDNIIHRFMGSKMLNKDRGLLYDYVNLYHHAIMISLCAAMYYTHLLLLPQRIQSLAPHSYDMCGLKIL